MDKESHRKTLKFRTLSEKGERVELKNGHVFGGDGGGRSFVEIVFCKKYDFDIPGHILCFQIIFMLQNI